MSQIDDLGQAYPLPRFGDLSPDFVALTLNAGYTFQQLEAAKSGMAVMQMNISQDKLRAIPIPLPPLAEQHRIVAKVQELMSLCDRLERALQDATTTRTRLLVNRRAKLTPYRRPKLTPLCIVEIRA